MFSDGSSLEQKKYLTRLLQRMEHAVPAVLRTEEHQVGRGGARTSWGWGTHKCSVWRCVCVCVQIRRQEDIMCMYTDIVRMWGAIHVNHWDQVLTLQKAEASSPPHCKGWGWRGASMLD